MEYRDTTPEDLPYAWAAYKRGQLPFEGGMSPAEFRDVFTEYAASYGRLFTVFADADPIGFVFSKVEGRVATLLDAVWFREASPRNIFEASASMLNSMRKDVADDKAQFNNPMRYFTVLVYTPDKDKKFFERICSMGILRRVGKIMDVDADGPMDLFQTRSPVGGK